MCRARWRDRPRRDRRPAVRARRQWHTFWNATHGPARVLEIISPAGLDKFFDQMTDLAAQGQSASWRPDPWGRSAAARTTAHECRCTVLQMN